MQHSTRVGRWLAAAVLAITPWAVDAAGLGRLAVQSSLGQPFHAEIDLVGVPKDEVGTLSVRLAPPAAYEQAGLQYNNVIAGLALRIERRPNGQPYIKVTSTRPVNEFVVDVLVDLSWASGRIMREYRVLLDPPGVPAAPLAESRPAPAAVERPPPVAIDTPARGQTPAPRALPVEPAARTATPGTYGPVKRGDTLSQIAREVRPDGVSVEQMLVGLYRSNPEAFIRKNMNLMRSGKILRVPERTEIAAIPHEEALEEYRAQVADWNSYRQSIAQSPAPAPEGGSAKSGRISARVEDTTAGATRDVVRLSKGEPPGASAEAKGAAKGGDEAQLKQRLRALEEEIVAREKALSEANERIAQLEKTVKDMQRLMEMKSAGMAAAQQKAEGAAKPQPSVPPQAQPAETKPAPAPVADAKPKPKPAAKPASAPPLPPEPSLVETLLANPLHLAGIGLAILAGAVFWLMRRRRSEGSRAAQLFSPAASGFGDAPRAAAGAGAVAAAASAQEAAPDVDPVEEARIYVMHGRDAQAETILKEGLARDPRREAIHVKLLEIYAARQDRGAFAKYAQALQKLTRGEGENWLKVAAMGYALDSGNPLYAAGKDASTAPAAHAARSADLDLDLDLAAGGSATPDMNLDAVPEAPSTQAEAAHATPDFHLEIPAGKPAVPSPEPTRDVAPLDFHIELPPSGNPGSTPPRAESSPSFKLPEIDLNLDEKGDATGGGAAKDAHWYDVQTKFDLAKAYEEMGDKAGARQILEEVIREGDAEQQTQAKQLLSKLS